MFEDKIDRNQDPGKFELLGADYELVPNLGLKFNFAKSNLSSSD